MRQITNLQKLQEICHQTAKTKGFWDSARNDAEMIALMHSELSEMLEELRKPDVVWESVAEELADVFIRGLDYAGGRKLNLVGAINKKMVKNSQRPYKHGKQF